ncbi:MAG: hypothetical protein PHD11_08240 [Bacteroidales bacterium]|nr:hypothetical protein [Bacteroidales bacterium]MDD4671139.1 hypothetical protein [Bacteroidales bacterium]
MRKNWFFLIASLILFSSCSHSEYWNTLCEIDNYIEDKPDSALAVLNDINSDELIGREEKAVYALLTSMALDKNYIDTTDFEVLQPAIDYYGRHGDATDKMRTLYYQGRIFSNKKDNASALLSYIKALEQGEDSQDTLTKARILFAQGIIYNSLYKWNEYIEVNRQAADYFLAKNKRQSYINCLIKVIMGYCFINDEQNTSYYVGLVENNIDSISVRKKSEFYACRISYMTMFCSNDSIRTAVDNYIKETPAQIIDWLSVANGYRAIGDYVNALKSINLCKETDIAKNESRYYANKSTILQKNGLYEEALMAYIKYVELNDAALMAVYKHDTQFTEDKYKLETETVKARQQTYIILILSLLGLLTLISVILFIQRRLHKKEEENNILQNKYHILEQERNNLSIILDENKLDNESNAALCERIRVLNTFFTARITNNNTIDEEAVREMERLIEDKDKFMASTRLSFASSHPDFINVLHQQGLSDSEIEYCCLYAIGLNGKEIGSYLNMNNHYDFSSKIRTKLKMNTHDTNLGTFIKKLLKQ